MKRITNLLIILMMAMNMESSAQTISGNINGHEYVDLGLPSGLKWATVNLTNTCFAWGDKENGYPFSCDGYIWCKRKSHKLVDLREIDNIDLFQITKYGEKDGKTSLEAADDAARVLWGAPWRMPTAEELQELYDGCQWEYFFTNTDRVKVGFKGTSKYNGATIFLPNGPDGGRITSFEQHFMTVEWASVCASLWSSSRASTEWDAKCLMLIHNLDAKRDRVSGGVGMELRYRGLPIRAVCQ